MAPLKIGLIGVGGRGESLLRLLLKCPEVQVTAIADVVEARVAALAQGGIAGFTSHVALMESGKVEAAVIATPHPFHAAIAVDAAQRGLHILCEKPIAVRVSEADRMVEAAKAHGVLLGLMFNRRLEPVHQQARAIIEAEALGEIYEVEMVSTAWFRLQSYYDSGAWRATWKGEGGGILANQAPHDLDLLVWLGGLPARVKATLRSRIHRIETENTVHAILEYDGVKTGTYRATTIDPLGKRRMEIAGEKGRLVIEGGKLLHCRYPQPLSEHALNAADKKASPFQSEWKEIPLPGGGNTSEGVVSRFGRAIRFSEPLVATGEDGVRALELANALHLSGCTDRPVPLPVDRAAVDALFEELQAGKVALAAG